MRDRPVSGWLADAPPDASRPALGGDIDADVAIMGAGFTGLWTAYALTELDPSLRIAIVEAEHVGFGASGRNGGWCTAGLSVTPSELTRRFGHETARRTLLTMQSTLDELLATCEREGIDARTRRGGILRIARGAHEVPAMRAGHAARAALGLAGDLELLDASQVAARVCVARAHGALFDPHGATVHPGRMVRGLADVVTRRGVAIYESTRVVDVADRREAVHGHGGAPRLITDRGEVRAEALVLAGEAFLAGLPRTRRRVLPVYSLIVTTEPLSAAQWSAIGWDGGECLSSHRYTVDYLARTDDGRILFGGRGAPYHYGSGIDPAHDRHGPTHATLRAQLLDWFPALRGIGFADAWGGAVGLSRDWLPAIDFDPSTGVACALGYGGQGVATAHLAGKALAHLITGTPTQLTALPMVGHQPRRWEPEPIRWLAVRYLQGALARIDEQAAATGRPPTGRHLAERLTRH